jgi:methionyl-tRNA formyltransferase
MLTLRDVVFLAAPTVRSRAYAQALAAAGLLPSLVVRFPGAEPAWDEEADYSLPDAGGLRFGTFRPGVTVAETLAQVPSVTLGTADINHAGTLSMLRAISQKVVIYSGASGAILRNEALGCGSRFLHVHGGSAPGYRGSTAFYYELLERGRFGVTALWLERELDRGPMLGRRTFMPPPGVELDRVVDPMARAALLVEVLRAYSRTGRFQSVDEPNAGGRVHYVIHPVLKHLTLRRSASSSDRFEP